MTVPISKTKFLGKSPVHVLHVSHIKIPAASPRSCWIMMYPENEPVSSQARGNKRAVEPFAFEPLAKARPSEPTQCRIEPSPAVPLGDGHRSDSKSNRRCACDKKHKDEPTQKSGQS